MEIIGYMIINFIFSFIGWVSLYAWYRDSNKVEKVKNERYAGEFSNAGRILSLNFIAGAGAIVMSALVLFVLGNWIYKSIAS